MVAPNDRKLTLSLGRLFLLSNLVLGVVGFGYLHWMDGQSQVKIWVPNRDLSAYTQIKSTDLTEKTVSAKSVSSKVLKEVDKIRDRYTLVAIPKDQPITKVQLSSELASDEKRLLQNSVLIGIPATPAMILSGNLKAGDRVDLIIVPESAEKQPNAKSILFNNTLVFDIKSNSTNSPTSQSPELVIVLAIPTERREEFSRSLVGRKAILSRKL